jgi:hypothetical protein
VSQISEDAVRLALASAREQLAAEITEAIEKAVREERAAVVAWLRDAADTPDGHARWLMLRIVDGLERGEHRREGEP